MSGFDPILAETMARIENRIWIVRSYRSGSALSGDVYSAGFKCEAAAIAAKALLAGELEAIEIRKRHDKSWILTGIVAEWAPALQAAE